MAERVTIEELYRLGGSLPTPMSRAAVNGFVVTRGLDAAHRRLIAAHLAQCRTLCKHFRDRVEAEC